MSKHTLNNLNLGHLLRFQVPCRIVRISLIMALMVGSNLVTHAVFSGSQEIIAVSEESQPKLPEVDELYLINEAGKYIEDTRFFEYKVRKVAEELEIAPEWLMAVMYAESRFNASAKNLKGSGAFGLIQFMPIAARDIRVRMSDIKNMDAIQQLEPVKKFLKKSKRRYGGFRDLTDTYLAILYPRARKEARDYVLFSKPSRGYRQNSGLDENRDGRISIEDIDIRLQRIFPTAYAAERGKIKNRGTQFTIGEESTPALALKS